jgi:protein-S-isoprenylcysteine O-methyltransferase Ste14
LPRVTAFLTAAGIARALLGALAVTALDAALLGLGLGGLGALLRHPRALALLAAWAVGGVVLALLRPVRTHDPLEVRRDPAFAMAGLFFIPLLTPAFSAWTERTGLWPLPGGAALGWAGVVLSAAGFAVRIAAMARLGSRFSPLVAVQKSHTLETGGPYAWVRHPGYLGAWLTTLGAVLAFGSGPGLAPALLMLLILQDRVRREDEVLERHFGDQFRHYRARTGALLPRRFGTGS